MQLLIVIWMTRGLILFEVYSVHCQKALLSMACLMQLLMVFLSLIIMNLCPFVLDHETQQAYTDISQRINTLLHAEEGTPASQLLEQLLIARVRLIMKAPAKKEAFKNWIEERVKEKDPRLRSMIVYAPEGFGDEEGDFKGHRRVP